MRPHASATMLVLAATLAACAPTQSPSAAHASLSAPTTRAATPPVAFPSSTTLPWVEVFKSPSCGCCGAWVEHLQQSGFPVRVHAIDAMEPVRKQLGVPYGKGSCHTASVDGYVIEGHVPAADIRRLLAERPNARGLALPGMPAGSPGMETADGHVQPHTVERIEHDGSTVPWSHYGR